MEGQPITPTNLPPTENTMILPQVTPQTAVPVEPLPGTTAGVTPSYASLAAGTGSSESTSGTAAMVAPQALTAPDAKSLAEIASATFAVDDDQPISSYDPANPEAEDPNALPYIVPYNEKSFKVAGDTKPYSTYLRQAGGRFNSKLRGGKGWIFSLSRQDQVNELLGKIHQGEVEPITDDQRKQMRMEKRKQNNQINTMIPTQPRNMRIDPNKQSVYLNLYLPRKGMTASIRVKQTQTQTHYRVFDVRSHNGIADEVYLSNGQTQVKVGIVYSNGSLRWAVLNADGVTPWTEYHTIFFR